MESILFKSLLYDFYGKLLTDKQRSCYEMYYCENLTLGEIGTELCVSLQAAGDIVRRTEKKLQNFEDKLGCIEKFQSQRRLADELCNALDGLEIIPENTRMHQELCRIKAGIRELVQGL